MPLTAPTLPDDGKLLPVHGWQVRNCQNSDYPPEETWRDTARAKAYSAAYVAIILGNITESQLEAVRAADAYRSHLIPSLVFANGRLKIAGELVADRQAKLDVTAASNDSSTQFDLIGQLASAQKAESILRQQIADCEAKLAAIEDGIIAFAKTAEAEAVVERAEAERAARQEAAAAARREADRAAAAAAELAAKAAVAEGEVTAKAPKTK